MDKFMAILTGGMAALVFLLAIELFILVSIEIWKHIF